MGEKNTKDGLHGRMWFRGYGAHPLNTSFMCGTPRYATVSLPHSETIGGFLTPVFFSTVYRMGCIHTQIHT